MKNWGGTVITKPKEDSPVFKQRSHDLPTLRRIAYLWHEDLSSGSMGVQAKFSQKLNVYIIK